ncbi:MAG: protease complex subunit PrcB family protein [Gemmatimonadaceae bacterium]
MRDSSPLFVAACAIVAIGCGNTGGPVIPKDASALQMQKLPELLVVEHYSGISTRERLVIRDASTWASTWAEIMEGRSPTPPVPAVDFANEMIILAAMGGRSTGGYSIEFKAVHEASGRVYATVEERSPGSNCFVTNAVTAPLAGVRAPLREGEVVFVEKQQTTNC